MKIIATLREKDIYPGRQITPEEEYAPPRKAVRIVLFDKDGQIALGYYEQFENRLGGYNIPGGGIDEGETIQDALTRECLEEIGCKIKNIQELGIVNEFGVGKKIKHFQENYCFTAEVDGEKGMPQFSDEEIENKLGLKWLTIDEAIGKVKLQKDNFGTRKTLLLLEEAKATKLVVEELEKK